MKLTRSQASFLEKLQVEREAWAVPCQYRMVRALAAKGYAVLTDERRHNRDRGTSERKVLPGEALP